MQDLASSKGKANADAKEQSGTEEAGCVDNDATLPIQQGVSSTRGTKVRIPVLLSSIKPPLDALSTKVVKDANAAVSSEGACLDNASDGANGGSAATDDDDDSDARTESDAGVRTGTQSGTCSDSDTGAENGTYANSDAEDMGNSDTRSESEAGSGSDTGRDDVGSNTDTGSDTEDTDKDDDEKHLDSDENEKKACGNREGFTRGPTPIAKATLVFDAHAIARASEGDYTRQFGKVEVVPTSSVTVAIMQQLQLQVPDAQEVHGEHGRLFVCPFHQCGKASKRKADYKKHYRAMHPTVASQAQIT